MTTEREALRMALDALEECRRDPRLKYEHPHYDKTITAIREVLAQPEQEPFGYFRYDLPLDAWVQNRAGLTGTPFYTTPQPAYVATPLVPERKPLSQYAIDRIVGRLQVGFTYAVELDDMTKIARAIEAAHGIKE